MLTLKVLLRVLLMATIFLVDMQSFYAAVEQADHQKWQGQPLIVSGDPERRSGVVLAASPEAKAYGVQNADRLWEAQVRCPQAIIVRPRMKMYLDVSLEITRILEQFTDIVEPFSVDEQFMDITPVLKYWALSPWQIAHRLQEKIMAETGVYARVGIGSNKLLAKFCCDHIAKKNDYGIFLLNHDNKQKYMWPLPVDALFGVGSRMAVHLRKMGLSTVGQLAHYPLRHLRQRWGINGEVLWRLANGYDDSPVVMDTFDQTQKGLGHSMTLPYDYCQTESLFVVLLELCEEVCFRARRAHVCGSTVSLGIGGAIGDEQTGFHRQVTLPDASSDTMTIFEAVKDLVRTFWNQRPVRRVSVKLSGLRDIQGSQLNLFHEEVGKYDTGAVMDHIKNRFGQTAIMRADSLMDGAQSKERAQKIGGHYQ